MENTSLIWRKSCFCFFQNEQNPYILWRKITICLFWQLSSSLEKITICLFGSCLLLCSLDTWRWLRLLRSFHCKYPVESTSILELSQVGVSFITRASAIGTAELGLLLGAEWLAHKDVEIGFVHERPSITFESTVHPSLRQ